MTTIAVLGTCDTKLQELLYLRQQILIRGCKEVILIDCGRSNTKDPSITITQEKVISYSNDDNVKDLSELPRGEVIKYMVKCTSVCIKSLYEDGKISGIVSAGGSGGTSLTTAVMREALPIGFPKLVVSTVASGDTEPLVGECDITMTYSVVDIAGSNPLLRAILSNAAGAIVGMAQAYEQRSVDAEQQGQKRKKRVGVTMFGVTTPCVDMIRQHLEEQYGYEVYVFHATGTGGKAMERLVREGGLDAVIDLTTTEICDFLMGGNMSAGPDRLEAAAKAGIPYIVSVGATDMVNFGAKVTIPQQYKDRKVFEHNPTVTLMRTTAEECKKIGKFLTGKLKDYAMKPENVKVVLPLDGVSMISVKGQAFEDKEADEALFKAITEGLKDTEIEIFEEYEEVNSRKFAVGVAEKLVKLIENDQ